MGAGVVVEWLLPPRLGEPVRRAMLRTIGHRATWVGAASLIVGAIDAADEVAARRGGAGPGLGGSHTDRRWYRQLVDQPLPPDRGPRGVAPRRRPADRGARNAGRRRRAGRGLAFARGEVAGAGCRRERGLGGDRLRRLAALARRGRGGAAGRAWGPAVRKAVGHIGRSPTSPPSPSGLDRDRHPRTAA